MCIYNWRLCVARVAGMKFLGAWDRLVWGAEFTGGIEGDKPMLIGASWSWDSSTSSRPKPCYGEPSRALLFETRKLAREWCHRKQSEYAGRSDCCRYWKFRAVRVRETVIKL